MSNNKKKIIVSTFLLRLQVSLRPKGLPVSKVVCPRVHRQFLTALPGVLDKRRVADVLGRLNRVQLHQAIHTLSIIINLLKFSLVSYACPMSGPLFLLK